MNVDIIKVISVTKHPKGNKPRPGYHRVEAVVRWGKNGVATRHVDTQNDKIGLLKPLKPKEEQPCHNKKKGSTSGTEKESRTTTSSISPSAFPTSQPHHHSSTKAKNTSNWSSAQKRKPTSMGRHTRFG